jgi:MFS transporter, Spinster family, sphingosine-1-phosphate transporter
MLGSDVEAASARDPAVRSKRDREELIPKLFQGIYMNRECSAAFPAPAPAVLAPNATAALWLLLGINLFNYIDRQVLSAVLPKLSLDASLFRPDDPNLRFKLGALTTAFLVSYMLLSPVFGRLADWKPRWMLVGVGVVLWSLASGGSGLASSFWLLLATRCLVGVGEAAYGPIAPAMLSDLYPERHRGRILARFYLAIPVGSALGFMIGGKVADTAWGWRGAFLVVVLPGLLLGALCFLMKEPPRSQQELRQTHGWRDYVHVFQRIWKVSSFRRNTIAMTASTFILGGVAAFAPLYIFQREARFKIEPDTLQRLSELKASDGSPVVSPAVVDKLKPLVGGRIYDAAELKAALTVLSHEEIEQYNLVIFENVRTSDSPTSASISVIFGAIVVVSGLFATLLGGVLGDRLRERYPGAYFLVAGYGCLVSFPFFLAMLFVPFPYAWLCMFVAVFGLFVNTGPANTILANVVPSSIRASAFAINILIIHLLGDAISPLVIGSVADLSSLHEAFLITSFFILIAGLVWRTGAPHLQTDTQAALAEESAQA